MIEGIVGEFPSAVVGHVATALAGVVAAVIPMVVQYGCTAKLNYLMQLVVLTDFGGFAAADRRASALLPVIYAVKIPTVYFVHP